MWKGRWKDESYMDVWGCESTDKGWMGKRSGWMERRKNRGRTKLETTIRQLQGDPNVTALFDSFWKISKEN